MANSSDDTAQAVYDRARELNAAMEMAVRSGLRIEVGAYPALGELELFEVRVVVTSSKITDRSAA